MHMIITNVIRSERRLGLCSTWVCVSVLVVVYAMGCMSIGVWFVNARDYCMWCVCGSLVVAMWTSPVAWSATVARPRDLLIKFPRFARKDHPICSYSHSNPEPTDQMPAFFNPYWMHYIQLCVHSMPNDSGSNEQQTTITRDNKSDPSFSIITKKQISQELVFR